MGTHNEDLIWTLKENGFKYARTIESTNEFTLPENPMLWNPTCHFLDDNIEELFERFLKYNEDNSIFYIWGHTYELITEEDFNKFESLCKVLSGHEEVAYLTNIEIIHAMQ
jgi:hypothetical protein